MVLFKLFGVQLADVVQISLADAANQQIPVVLSRVMRKIDFGIW